MKYSRRLHRAMILAAFALLFAVIGSAYCQIDSVTWAQWKGTELGKSVHIVSRNDTVWAQSDTGNVLLWPVVDIVKSSWSFQDTLKGDTVPSPSWSVVTVDSATSAQWANEPFRIGAIDTIGSIHYAPAIITFTDSLGQAVLVLHPNGDIFWRGRLVTTDSILVQGLRDIIEGRR